MAWVLMALGLVLIVEGLAYALAPSLIERVLELLRHLILFKILRILVRCLRRGYFGPKEVLRAGLVRGGQGSQMGNVVLTGCD